jgi:hypothetical protein
MDDVDEKTIKVKTKITIIKRDYVLFLFILASLVSVNVSSLKSLQV